MFVLCNTSPGYNMTTPGSMEITRDRSTASEQAELVNLTKTRRSPTTDRVLTGSDAACSTAVDPAESEGSRIPPMAWRDRCSRPSGRRPSVTRTAQNQAKVASATVAPEEVTSFAPLSWSMSTRIVFDHAPIPSRSRNTPAATVDPLLAWSMQTILPS